MKLICNFDASAKVDSHTLGYIIRTENGVILLQKSIENQSRITSYTAERRALEALLRELLKIVIDFDEADVRGDCQNLIHRVNHCLKKDAAAKKHGEVLQLCKMLRERARLSLKWVPRKKNKVADKLSRRPPLAAAQLPSKSRSKYVDRYLRREEIPMGDICIPRIYSRPAQYKIEQCAEHYALSGILDRDIVLDTSNLLQDGYIAYLALRMLRVDKANVCYIPYTPRRLKYNHHEYYEEVKEIWESYCR